MDEDILSYLKKEGFVFNGYKYDENTGERYAEYSLDLTKQEEEGSGG